MKAAPVTELQREALETIENRRVGGAEQTALYQLRDHPPFIDGRTLTGLVRRGLLERLEPEPPYSEPSYKLTHAGRQVLAD